ncbi:MAG: hypothetical protein ABW352_25920 [Polyangiales bacterium]
MKFSTGGAPRVGAGAFFAVLALSAHARADQFIVADETYVHSKDTTSDSHYRKPPREGTPKDWTKPTNWSKGSVHVTLEVKTKPSDAPTKFQICFEGTPTYACTNQSETYTKPGTYKWSTPFSAFYQGNGMQMNWANGVKQVALILKDDKNGKPQGDPKYVPSSLHVEVAVVSEGATYKPPTAAPADAGVVDAGSVKSDASTPVDASTPPTDAGIDEPTPEDASTPPRTVDASTTPRRDASIARPDASTPTDDEPGDAGAPTASSGSDGCALGGGASHGWLALLALAWLRRFRPLSA